MHHDNRLKCKCVINYKRPDECGHPLMSYDNDQF